MANVPGFVGDDGVPGPSPKANNQDSLAAVPRLRKGRGRSALRAVCTSTAILP